MAEKAHNDFLVDLYLRSVENPVLINTKTGESIFDFAREESKVKFQHIIQTIPVTDESHCPICLEGWDEFDEEGNLIENEEAESFENVGDVNGRDANPGQRLEFLCPKIGHAFHNRCIERLQIARGCPICKAPVQPQFFPHRKVGKAEFENDHKKKLLGDEIQNQKPSKSNKKGVEGPEKSDNIRQE